MTGKILNEWRFRPSGRGLHSLISQFVSIRFYDVIFCFLQVLLILFCSHFNARRYVPIDSSHARASHASFDFVDTHVLLVGYLSPMVKEDDDPTFVK